MIERPRLHSERLLLRQLELYNAPELQRLAGDRAIASTTF